MQQSSSLEANQDRVPSTSLYVNYKVYSFYEHSVNFTNLLRAAFTLVDLESVKKIDNLTVVFMLLGSACIKAVRRMLMK